jgi:hypothetical protein
MARTVVTRLGILVFSSLLVLVTSGSASATNPVGPVASQAPRPVPTRLDVETGSEVHYLPATRVRVGRHAVARDGRAALVVECRVGEPGEVCRGGIGLHGLRPDGNGSFYVGKAHFEIPLGARATVWASLSEGARAVLARRGRLTANVFSVILVGVSEVKVTITAARNGHN